MSPRAGLGWSGSFSFLRVAQESASKVLETFDN
jgi:hypothetical protein